MTGNTLDKSALERLLAVIGGDLEDFQELKEEFLETAPEILFEMQAAAVSGDLNALRVASHSLKGNARDFGATKLSALCADLEAKCKEGAAFDASAMLKEIATATTATQDALKGIGASDFG